MLAIVHTCALMGLDGCLVEVQTHFNNFATIPSFTIVGLPGSAVKESRERVRAAIKNSKLRFPPKAYTVNLSPADLPKHGPAYDLPIAISALAATEQIRLDDVQDALFLGELSLDGRVQHVKGVLSLVYTAAANGIKTVYVPAADAEEAALVRDVQVYPVQTLAQLVEHLYDMNPIPAYQPNPVSLSLQEELPAGIVDFADVKGQETIKRALEIAAAGGHNVLMTGSPGVGKSLLAKAMPGILPPLTKEEALDVTRIYSVADMLPENQSLITQRPFRAPHYTISQAGLVGGGTIPKPGEITLAHYGVLFLDEILEFSGKTLEVLRAPLEDRRVTISRANGSITFPANFMLVAARNPCECGYYGDNTRACTCSPTKIQKYQARLSGPMMDRFDIHVDVPRVEYDKLMSDARGESSLAIRQRVTQARQRQLERFADYPGLFTNADMGTGEVQQLCQLSDDAKKLLDVSVRRMTLSARAYHRVLKLGRTIADLANSELIAVPHIAEALQYRESALENAV